MRLSRSKADVRALHTFSAFWRDRVCSVLLTIDRRFGGVAKVLWEQNDGGGELELVLPVEYSGGGFH
jgi:hypothetical protein